MMSPFFSIIVPVYNTEKFLDECINSVINQSFSNWELILVDDGSIDNSGRICDNYSRTSENIVTIHQENRGQFFAREVGIKNAKGQFFVFLDSDDFFQANALSTLYECLDEKETDLILYDSYHFVNGKQENAEDNIDFSGLFYDKKEIIKQCFLKRTSRISMCAYCFKSTLFKNNFNDSLYQKSKSQEDFLMAYSLIENSSSLRVIDKILYNYRTNADSASHNVDIKNFFGGLKISSEIYQDILKKYDFDIHKDFDEYIIRRLSWLPLSYLIRYANAYSAKLIKHEFKKIKEDFLYIRFTSKYRFEGKSYRLFMLFLKLRLYILAKKISSRLL